MRSARSLRGLIGAVVLCAALTGCYTTDKESALPIEGKFDTLMEVGQSAPLAVLTEFDWDKAYFFKHPTSQAVIDATLGPDRVESYKSADSSTKLLLVFENEGKIVDRIPLQEYLTSDLVELPRNVLAVPTTKSSIDLVAPER